MKKSGQIYRHYYERGYKDAQQNRWKIPVGPGVGAARINAYLDGIKAAQKKQASS